MSRFIFLAKYTVLNGILFCSLILQNSYSITSFNFGAPFIELSPEAVEA